jgi:lipoprotein-anchoring transpeptidase ErfK/SrfK
MKEKSGVLLLLLLLSACFSLALLPRTACAEAEPLRLVVTKSVFTLEVFEGERTVETFAVAVGKNPGDKQSVGDFRTPEGEFSISSIEDSRAWTHDFGDGKGIVKGAYGPWFIRLATPGWKGIGIHGTHDAASIGTAASEGCIRLKNSDLLRLVARLSVGTRVEIRP